MTDHRESVLISSEKYKALMAAKDALYDLYEFVERNPTKKHAIPYLKILGAIAALQSAKVEKTAS